VDGELVGEDRAALDGHPETCAPCRELLAEERATVELLAAARQRPRAPEALRARIEALTTSPREHPRRRARRWLAAAAAVGVVAFLAGRFLGERGTRVEPRASSALVSLAVDSHLRYARGQLPLEVSTERPDRVSSFFAGRVPFALTLPDYPVGPGQRKSYRLEGGRLVSFRNDYAAYVAYRMEGQPISLLVTSASTAKPEGGSLVSQGTLTFHIESVSGLKVITWTDNGLTYALASDVAVEGADSCLVCHGSDQERRRLDTFPSRPTI
jgi:anti-sigma factor RsiW